MASETHVLAHSESEEVEKKVESEVKKVAEEESLCPDEPKAKAEEKRVEPPVVEEVKAIDVDENAKAGDNVEPNVDRVEDKPAEPVVPKEPTKIEATPLAEPAVEKIECKPVEPLAEQTIESKPVQPLAEEKIASRLVEPSAEELKQADVAEWTGDKIEDVAVEPCLADDGRNSEVAELTEYKSEEDKANEAPKVEEKKTEDATIVEPSDKGIEEVTKEVVAEPDTVSVSGSGIEKADGKVEERSEPEQGENLVEELQTASLNKDSAKLCGISESLPAEVVEEKPGEVVIEHKEATISVVESKLGEESNVVKQIEKYIPEAAPVQKVEFADEVGDVKLAKEEEIDAAKSLDQVKPESPVEEKDVECYQAELAKETAEVKGSLEGEVVEAETIGTKTEERSGVAEELVSREEKLTEDAISSIPPPEKAAEEITSRVNEQSVENGTNKDQTVASAEPAKQAEVMDNADTGAIKELDKCEATGQKEAAVEAKVEEEKRVDKILEESAQATEPKVEETKQVDDHAKTEVQKVECTKDAGEMKTDDLKENVPVKSHKPSIVKMMKQSLVKAKKAIIGKSQNSKTLAREPTTKG